MISVLAGEVGRPAEMSSREGPSWSEEEISAGSNSPSLSRGGERLISANWRPTRLLRLARRKRGGKGGPVVMGGFSAAMVARRCCSSAI